MAETDIDEYKLDTNKGKKHQTLRVSLINDELVSLVITEINNPKDKYYNLIRLDQFRSACEAFDETKTIKEALNLIKETIEGGRILLSEDEENKNIDIKFNITLNKKTYPPFVIGLPIGPEEEEEEVKSETNKIENENENENDVEVLPTKFDYQGDLAAESKYGKTMKNTTEISDTIIKSQMKEPNLVLEYIEPILQVHYPDGTTKSTPLPPRLQTVDGKKPNINPEQLKSLHEQMALNFSQSISEYERENARSNSVSNKKITATGSNYSRQTVSSFGNNNNTMLRQANSHNINTENKNKRINITLNNMNIANNSNSLNTVRSAIKTKPNITFNNSLSNIRSTRTSFNPYEGNERGTDTNVVNKNNAPRDNDMNHKKQNRIIKGNSDYSTSSVPNKPLVIPSYYGSIPNPTIKNSINITNTSISNKNSKYMNLNQSVQGQFIQGIPRFINQNQNPNTNNNMYDRGLNKSSSSPSMGGIDKVNYNFYQNQGQTQFSFPPNQNLTYIQNQINNVNLRYKFQQPNPNINLNQSIPNLYQASKQAFNNISQDFTINAFQNQNQNQNYVLTRHNSSQAPMVSQSFIAQMKNNQNNYEEQRKIFQLKNMQVQKRIQEQKKMGQQKQKTNNNIIKQVAKNKPPINQSQMLKSQQSQQVNNYQQKNSQPLEKSLNSQKQTQPPLKQSYSQQIIRQKPPLKNEITQQQIALAQMASLQNLQNPKNFNIAAVQLNQKFLDSQGNEETQSQYEREEDEQQEKRPDQPQKQLQEQEQYEINESNEAQVFENLYRTEEGFIIFRNGLLRGITHKFAEITDVVSKIQIMVTAGVKFNLLYRASDHGDKAKTFHEKCDKHQMTLVLVETTKGRRFGGFTTKTWDGNCLKKVDNDAFVFSLDTKKIYDIRHNEYAIGGYPKFGPVFFGCQIRIYDEFFKKGGTTCQRGLNYKTKKDYELNNGEQTYIVKEIEVYDVEVIKMS